MKIKYVGPLDAVDVPELGLTDVRRNHQVEASGAVAESLLEQPDVWQKVTPPKKRATKTAAKKTDPPKQPSEPDTGTDDQNEE